MHTELSLIIPGKNEALNIEPLIKRINSAFQGSQLQYTIIFINDGSTDESEKILHRLHTKYPLQIITHTTSVGKAQSIIEGVESAKTEYVVMIDADLQYPPEAIPEMIKLSESYEVVVARRVNNNEKIVRKLLSTIHRYIFGKLLFNLSCDIQSGLKLFPKDLIYTVDKTIVTPWTLDLSLLNAAIKSHYQIGEVPISFEERKQGQSKVNIFQSIYEHTVSATKIKLSNWKK